MILLFFSLEMIHGCLSKEMLQMLALPPESAIASLAVGLDPLSRERFNQSISKLEDRMRKRNQSWIGRVKRPL